MKLSNEEVTRYSRHLTLPEVGMQGQLKLKEAKVLMIGAGGLGSPLGMYLGAAGVGTITGGSWKLESRVLAGDAFGSEPEPKG